MTSPLGILWCFFLVLGLLRGAELEDFPAIEGSNIASTAWTVYKTRFNQERSTPVSCFDFAGKVTDSTSFWRMLGGEETFLKTKRVDYDVFSTSSPVFDGLSHIKSLNFDFLKAIHGITYSFLVNPVNAPATEKDLHRFDALLDVLIRGTNDSQLKTVFGFSFSRKFSNTVFKIWIFTGVHLRPNLWPVLRSLVKEDLGSPRMNRIDRVCSTIMGSTAYYMMPSPVASAVEPGVSFAAIAAQSRDSAEEPPTLKLPSECVQESSSSESSESSRSSEVDCEIEQVNTEVTSEETVSATPVVPTSPLLLPPLIHRSLFFTDEEVFQTIINKPLTDEELYGLSKIVLSLKREYL